MGALSETLQRHVDGGSVPGVVALAARGDDVRVEAVGARSLGGEPMTRDTIFRVASITKPITAALTMMLVEDGVLRIDDPVRDLLPELAEPRVLRTVGSPLDDTVACERPITLRHLLTFTHGLGFPTDFGAPICAELSRLHQGPPEPQHVPPPDEWMADLAEVPLLHQPEEGWTYNTGSDILGVLLARAARMPLGELMRARVFEPLGMQDTAFHVPRDRLDRFATHYRHAESGELEVADEPTGQWSTEPRFPSGAGGLVSTVDDWLAFGRVMLAGGEYGGHRLLARESVDLMTTDHTTAAMREMAGFFLEGQGWGFGGSVDITETEPWNAIGRYGWIGGTGTAAYVDWEAETVTVVLSQVELGGPGGDTLLGDALTAARREIAS